MRPSQYTLGAATVQRHFESILTPVLGPWPTSWRCTASMVISVLAYAAARITSIADACARLTNAPSDDTVRNALTKQLPTIPLVEQRLQAALTRQLPRAVRRRAKWDVAMDLTLIPYHGREHNDTAEVYRAQARSGTTHFHAYATAYLICSGQPYTLALTFVRKGRPIPEVVAELRRRLARVGITARKLLLDRGFCSAPVIRYLQCARQPFIMPQAVRGRAPKAGKPLTGLRRIRAKAKTGWTTYSYTPAGSRRVTVALCVVRRQRKDRRGGRASLYACWGVQQPPASVRKAYRTRFGIETGYRQMNQARIRTTTRKPVLRLLFVGIALILRNLWVWLHWAVLAKRQRGGRYVNLARLRLRTMLVWLVHVAETRFAFQDTAEAQVLIGKPFQSREL